MKIVKGSSFATWTKKLQGKGVGFSRSKSSSPRNVSPSHQKLSVMPSLGEAIDERGESERSARHGNGHRDDAAEGRDGIHEPCGAPDITCGGAAVSEDESEEGCADVLPEESDQETMERLSILSKRGSTAVDRSVPTAVADMKIDNPITVFRDEMYEDGHNGSIVDSSSSSGVALCLMPTLSCSSEEPHSVRDVTSPDRKRLNQNGAHVKTHKQDTVLEKPEVSWGASLIGEADGVNLPKADEHVSVLEAFGKDKPAAGDHSGQANQDEKQTRDGSRSHSFEEESNVDECNGGKGCVMTGKSSGEPASVEGPSSEFRDSSGDDQCEKAVAHVADAAITAGEETRTHPSQVTWPKSITMNMDRLPCSRSQANIESEGPDSSSKDIVVTTERANDLGLALHVQETNNAKPGRRFPKTTLAAWAGLKRLTKNDKVAGQQDAAHAAGPPAQEKGTKKEVMNGLDGPSAKKIAIRNRMRQEKRALGRVKQKQRRLKNALGGVGEIIPAGGAPSQLPFTSTSTSGAPAIVPNQAPFSEPVSPLLSPLKTIGAEGTDDPKTAKPKREKMADMIWWSNENKSVEIIAVKSDELVNAWDEEEGKKELENNHAVGNLLFQAETQKTAPSKSKERPNDKSRKGGKSKSSEKKRLEKKGRSKTNQSGRGLASSSSDVSDNEHCACNDEVIQDGRILCGDHDGKAEEVGFPDIKNDLREMAKELLRKGPAAMVHWLE